MSITSVDQRPNVPLLKTRVIGDATIYRELPNKDRLGAILLDNIQAHTLFHEFVTFNPNFEIPSRRLRASWMDTMPPPEKAQPPKKTQELHSNLLDYKTVGH